MLPWFPCVAFVSMVGDDSEADEADDIEEGAIKAPDKFARSLGLKLE